MNIKQNYLKKIFGQLFFFLTLFISNIFIKLKPPELQRLNTLKSLYSLLIVGYYHDLLNEKKYFNNNVLGHYDHF